jgi:hypothetical protein
MEQTVTTTKLPNENSQNQLGSENNFEILDWKFIGKGYLLAACTLGLPSGLRIKDCGVFAKNGKRWLSMPSRQYAKPDGSKGYHAYIEFADDETRDAFMDAAGEALERHLAAQEQEEGAF